MSARSGEQAADPATDVLQEALAGEHAALYAYSVIGGRLSADDPLVARATEAYRVHRERRDALMETLRGRGHAPLAAEPGYALPRPVDGPRSARELARLVEDRCAVLHAAVVATASGQARRASVRAVVDGATRALTWGAQPSAFPGVGPV